MLSGNYTVKTGEREGWGGAFLRREKGFGGRDRGVEFGVGKKEWDTRVKGQYHSLLGLGGELGFGRGEKKG